MPAAMKTTTTSKPTGKTLPASIHQLSLELKTRAIDSWRTWAQTIAGGGDCPPARDVIDTANVLKIDNPASQLQADADAIEEVSRYEAAAELCRRTVAQKLAEFGSLQKLQAAVEAAKAEHARLSTILDDVHNGCSEPFWTSAAHRVRIEHPLIWPGAGPIATTCDDEAIDVEVCE